MNRYRHWWIAMALSTLASACSSDSERRFVLEGELSCDQSDCEAHYSDLAALAADGAISTLVLDSGGGTMEAALFLGQIVAAHDLEIEIRGLCGGVCFSHVAFASERITVVEGSIYGFAGSVTGQLALIDEIGSPPVPVYERLTELAAQEQALYRELGIPLTVLQDAWTRLVPREGYELDPTGNPTFAMRYEIWVPSPTYMMLNNISVSGDLIYIPSDLRQRREQLCQQTGDPCEHPWVFQ